VIAPEVAARKNVGTKERSMSLPVKCVPPAPRPVDSLWTVADVANYLRVSKSWVYHRALAGLLPHLRVGGLLRFDPMTIHRFVHEQSAA
jgi:excisionase family DNA binding protein